MKSLKGLKIAYSFDLGYMQVDAEVRRNMQALIDGLKKQGAKAEEVDLGWTSRHREAWWGLVEQPAFRPHHDLAGRQESRSLCDYTLKFAEIARKTTLDETCRALEMVDRMYQTFGPMMEKFDVFLCPTAMIPAVKAEQDPYDQNFRINGVKVDPRVRLADRASFQHAEQMPGDDGAVGLGQDWRSNLRADRRPHL